MPVLAPPQAPDSQADLFSRSPIPAAAPVLLLCRVKLLLNVLGTDEYYSVCAHQAKLSKCFEKMD